MDIGYEVARLYSQLYLTVKIASHRNLPGLRRVLKLVQDPRSIEVDGVKLFLEPLLATNYGVMLTGRPSEPETHKFFHAVVDSLETPPTVVDIGANIGEMAVLFAKRAHNVIAFEPFPSCAAVIRESAELNAFTNVEVRQKALADQVGFGGMGVTDEGSEYCAALQGEGDIPVSTLDTENIETDKPLFLLIDVEGAELRVMQGGRSLIRKHRPLIVFEYHSISKQSFSIDEIRAELGDQYEMFRLRRDGLLDHELEKKTWNAVAVPTHGVWRNSTERLITH
ncbi:MAG: FkbM family methyltransferase [Proteobacteria bacterium]|nr:FkbM family methyltransferase [Pseudomonadota bacterium]